jgi:hypothetical protein
MQRTSFGKLAFLAIAIALFATPAAAKPLPKGGVTREEIVTWLQQHGYSAEIRHFDKFVYVATQFNNGPPNNDYSGIYFYDCDENERCVAIQYFAAFAGDDTITVEKANDWNSHKRTIRAYRRESSSITGEYDLDVSPGGSTELLDKSLKRWEQILGIFKTFFDR